jgi:D-alanyl-D-alanine dipeptidase
LTPDLPRGTSANSESSHTSQNSDLSTWLTKQQAADAIGVSTKTIEQFAKDGKIQQAVYRPQNRGAAKAVYHPDDVARIAQERRQSPQPFVLPAGVTPPVNGNGHRPAATALSRNPETPTGEDVLRLVFAAALQRLSAEPPPTSENSEKSDWMTVAAVAHAWQWPRADVRRLSEAGKLGEQFTVGTGRRARVVLRRTAVQAFAAGRKDLEAL